MSARERANDWRPLQMQFIPILGKKETDTNHPIAVHFTDFAAFTNTEIFELSLFLIKFKKYLQYLN